MVERAIALWSPAAQRELLIAREPVYADTLGRHAHPREAVEKLLGLSVGGTKFEAGGNVLPVEVHEAVEPGHVHRPHHQHPGTERRGARRADSPLAVDRELGARLSLVGGSRAVEKELLTDIPYRRKVGERKRERPATPPTSDRTGHDRVRRHQCRPFNTTDTKETSSTKDPRFPCGSG